MCPNYANCPGNYQFLSGYTGYWTTPGYSDCLDNQDCLVFCLDNPSVCLDNNKCETGYTGVLCQVCDLSLNYQRQGLYGCAECSTAKTALSITFYSLLILVYCFLFLMSSYDFVARTYIEKVLKIGFDLPVNTQNRLSDLLFIALDYIQTLSIIMTIPIESIRGFYNFLSGLGAPMQ